MVLHNLLNERGRSLYLQVWDERNEEERKYDELPNISSGQGDVSTIELLQQLRREQTQMEQLRDELAHNLLP